MSASVVRSMQPDDVASVVALHLGAFPSFFLTFLGPRFLRQLYLGIMDDPAGIAFLAEENGRCVGFVAGTSTPSRFYARLLRRKLFRFAFAAVVPVLRRPSIVRRLLRAFSKPAEAATGANDRAELMSLAVASDSRKHGAGATLVGAFVDEARRRGCASVFLTTDAIANDSVNRFYEDLFFTRMRQFTTPEGRVMNEYELRL